MKILIIHNRYLKYGGEDTTFESEKRLLEQNGNEVQTLVFDNKTIKGVEKLKLLYNIFYNNESAKLLKNKLNQFKADIIHVHNFFYLASPAIFYVANLYKIPIVQTLQNFRLICSGSLLLRDAKVCELCINQKLPLAGIRYKCFNNSRLQTVQLTLMTSLHKYLGTWKNRIDTYICLTEFTKGKIMNSSLQIPAHKIAIKCNFVEDVGNSELKREDFYLFIGRLAKEKGIDTLLEAAKNQGFKLEIIGDGDLKKLVENAIQTHPNITYHGFQNKTFITNKLKTCKALIFPSIWYEGMPLTILESFSTGTPIIASDIDNVRDFIQDKVDGLHFKCGNVNDLVEKVTFFEENYSQLAHLYTQARATYEQNYTPQKALNKLMEIYQNTIDKRVIDKHIL